MGEYCDDNSIPVTELIRKLLKVTETQFVGGIDQYRDRYRNDEAGNQRLVSYLTV